VPRVRIVRPEVPPAIEAAIVRALAKAPAERFGTAEEFGGALGPQE
jgi:serine/threonine-protein kinase